MDSTLHIRQIGNTIRNLFPEDTDLIGQSLNEVFRLIRPDIYVEWDKVLPSSSRLSYTPYSSL